MTNRNERRAVAGELRRQAAAWPSHLVEIPKSQWPPRHGSPEYPQAVWRSRQYAVRPLRGVEARRLTVNRTALGSDGHWEQDIPWDDLQRCKRETGHGDWYGFEIYPRDRDLVNVANMRHLWLLAEPLDIGWFA